MSETAVKCQCCRCVGVGRCSHTGEHWYCFRHDTKQKEVQK